jgi:glutamyl-tRNA synthetase
MSRSYRGRLAPTPTGYLHLGHARTFWTAQERARQAGGALILRNEDLDSDRCRPEFLAACLEDLRWFGCVWDEGPDVGGNAGPYEQSARHAIYLDVWRRLCATGLIYPSPHSRKDVERALSAPHETDGEAIFPPLLRPLPDSSRDAVEPGEMNWRFRVPDGEAIEFLDGRHGRVTRIAGRDFGDFVVWRKDGWPAYELAVVADDFLMGITEVARGEDLLTSTARQLLLYRALGWSPPAFYHCPLMRNAAGVRLAKRDQALSLRTLREQGRLPAELRAEWSESTGNPGL